MDFKKYVGFSLTPRTSSLRRNKTNHFGGASPDPLGRASLSYRLGPISSISLLNGAQPPLASPSGQAPSAATLAITAGALLLSPVFDSHRRCARERACPLGKNPPRGLRGVAPTNTVGRWRPQSLGRLRYKWLPH